MVSHSLCINQQLALVSPSTIINHQLTSSSPLLTISNQPTINQFYVHINHQFRPLAINLSSLPTINQFNHHLTIIDQFNDRRFDHHHSMVKFTISPKQSGRQDTTQGTTGYAEPCWLGTVTFTLTDNGGLLLAVTCSTIVMVKTYWPLAIVQLN